MKIKSNASPQELSSPFFKANKQFCYEFETYMASKNGLVKGKYNAWSYLIEGKIKSPDNWKLKYKKSTFSSGNLFFSSKKQNLLVLVEWQTDKFKDKNAEFYIRTKSYIDVLRLAFDKSVSQLNLSKSYVVCFKGEKPYFFDNIITTLEHLFTTKELYLITYKNQMLTIELRSELHHFDKLNELIELNN